MAMGRFNRPSIMIYGGAIAPGHTTLSDPPKVINISSTFEAYGALLQGEIDEKNYQDIVRNACPGAGGCGGLYTASTSTTTQLTIIDISGFCSRSNGDVITRKFFDPSRTPPKNQRVSSRRQSHSQTHGKRYQAARHHDPHRLRECNGYHYDSWR